MGKHEGCALVLLQKGASVNVKVHPEDMAGARKEEVEYKFLSEHYDRDNSSEEYTLFQGIISNNWLGISHVALAQFESFGMTVARAVEVAFHMQKLQFAKNLLGKQVSGKKLRDKVTNGRDLLLSFAYECKADTHT